MTHFVLSFIVQLITLERECNVFIQYQSNANKIHIIMRVVPKEDTERTCDQLKKSSLNICQKYIYVFF